MNSDHLRKEIEIQKHIAYTAGILQGDITIKTLLESLALGVVIINDIGRIVLINNKMAELTGYTKQEIMGESINILIPMPHHHAHDMSIKKFFEQPRIRPMGIGMELTARRKDNSVIPVEISLSFLHTESGNLGIGFLTDISSRKKLESDLKKRNLELDSYAHTVAHNLNSSLVGMVGYSELLLDQGEAISKQEKETYIREIAQSGRKMSSIIKELLIFASMKKEDVDVAKVNMNRTIGATVERLKFQIDSTSATIVNRCTENCQGYEPWIEEVWLNLLSNAIKYGGERPQIEIRSELQEDGFVRYSISDNGEGIQKDLLDVLFENANKRKDKLSRGHGLGLTIVKQIIEKLGGRVQVDSERGKGTTVSFFLEA